VVLAVRSADPAERSRALDTLIRAYWRPVFRHVRAKWGADDDRAEDLAQGFFAAALEKGWLERFDPARGRFRSFLLSCLDGYAANELRARRRHKRGGETEVLPFEVEGEDGTMREIQVPDSTDPEAAFQREWARSLFALAVEALRDRCRDAGKQVAFTLFERYDLEGADAPDRPSYAQLAAELRLPATQVTNHLHWARREFRAALLRVLREITASDAEFRAEARSLLGVDPP
jgi:RNA polymerase sigma factor (sigma-70 family)